MKIVSTDNTRRVVVIPAHAGIQTVPPDLDPGIRRDDVASIQPCTGRVFNMHNRL